ncbi:hypothetical protein AAFF_G00215220, partial [Aldrovandia affinis]
KDWITQLREKSNELGLVEEKLDQDEKQFWVDLQERYLKPLDEDKKKQQQIKDDLKDLRNKATFIFFMINALWLVATFFLQQIGTAVTIPIPKLANNGTIIPGEKTFIDPIGLMFLLGFATLLIIQFFGMIWHRIQTLIHYIAYTGTEAKAVKKEMKRSMDKINEEKNFL